jgi:hypothetical protein
MLRPQQDNTFERTGFRADAERCFAPASSVIGSKVEMPPPHRRIREALEDSKLLEMSKSEVLRNEKDIHKGDNQRYVCSSYVCVALI